MSRSVNFTARANQNFETRPESKIGTSVENNRRAPVIQYTGLDFEDGARLKNLGELSEFELLVMNRSTVSNTFLLFNSDGPTCSSQCDPTRSG